MFSHEGSARSSRQNRLLAGYLAFVGGFVNSSGFVLVGTFTSHVTGNIGRLANDGALGQYRGAAAALSMVLCFFGGAFFVSAVLESNFFKYTSSAYSVALAFETALLCSFTLISYFEASPFIGTRDAEALLLCAAMGVQNALVTRISGAVVRTTHLTGVVTDLGIESARWFRFWRKATSEKVEKPSREKMTLLSTIAAAFVAGATAGAFTAVRVGHASMLFAAVAVGGCAGYAASHGRSNEDDPRLTRR